MEIAAAAGLRLNGGDLPDEPTAFLSSIFPSMSALSMYNMLFMFCSLLHLSLLQSVTYFGMEQFVVVKNAQVHVLFILAGQSA